MHDAAGDNLLTHCGREVMAAQGLGNPVIRSAALKKREPCVAYGNKAVACKLITDLLEFGS